MKLLRLLLIKVSHQSHEFSERCLFLGRCRHSLFNMLCFSVLRRDDKRDGDDTAKRLSEQPWRKSQALGYISQHVGWWPVPSPAWCCRHSSHLSSLRKHCVSIYYASVTTNREKLFSVQNRKRIRSVIWALQLTPLACQCGQVGLSDQTLTYTNYTIYHRSYTYDIRNKFILNSIAICSPVFSRLSAFPCLPCS